MAETTIQLLLRAAKQIKAAVRPTGPSTPLVGHAFPEPGLAKTVQAAEKKAAQEKLLEEAKKMMGEPKPRTGIPEEPAAEPSPQITATPEDVTTFREKFGQVPTTYPTEFSTRSERMFMGTNLSRLEGDPLKQTTAALQAMLQDKIAKQKRGVRTWDAEERAANRLIDSGKADLEWAVRLEPGTALNAGEMRALQKLRAGMSDMLYNQEFQQNAHSDSYRFIFGASQRLHVVTEAAKGEAARTLGVLRMPVAGEAELVTMDPRKLGDLAKQWTKEELIQMVNSQKKSDTDHWLIAASKTGGKALWETWINGLLSGKSVARKLVSDQSMLFFGLSERALAGQIGKVTQHLPEEGVQVLGKTVIGGGRGVEPGEATAMVFGMSQAVQDALRLSRLSWDGPSYFGGGPVMAPNIHGWSSQAFHLDPNDAIGHGIDLLGTYVMRAPGNVLHSTAEFYKTFWYRMSLYASAYRQARREALTDVVLGTKDTQYMVSQATQDRLKGEMFGAKVADLVLNPPPALQLEAQDLAQVMTFTKELGTQGKAFQALIREIPALRGLVPFFVTPTNVVKQGWQRAPLLSLTSAQNWRDIQAGGPARDLALARIGLGNLLGIGLGTLAASGRFTGSGVGMTPQHKKFLMDNKLWQPDSMWSDAADGYVKATEVEPYGNVLRDIADYMDLSRRSDDQGLFEAGAALAAALGHDVVQMSAFAGIDRAYQAVSDPEHKGPGLARQMAGSVVPGGVVEVARALSPEMKEVHGVMDSVMSRVGVGYARLDHYGRPILDDTPMPWMNLFRYQKQTDRQGLKAWRDNAATPRPVPWSLGGPEDYTDPNLPKDLRHGVSLSPEQHHRLAELRGNIVTDSEGRTLEQAETDLVGSDRYLNEWTEGPKGSRVRELTRNLHAFHTKAEQQLIRQEYPELGEQVDNLQAARRAAQRQDTSSEDQGASRDRLLSTLGR